MDLLDALPHDPAAWESHARELAADARRALGQAIAQEWIEGHLEPRLVDLATSEELTTLRRHLSLALDACDDSEFRIEWLGTTDESSARRWCWIRPWILLIEDEDLLLMGDHLIVPLLDEAAAGCTKRRYVFAIAEHHVRDQVHASLSAGPDAVRARIRELLHFRRAAVAAGHDSLVAYLDRLGSYERPQKVKRQEEASARVSDVWRCRAPTRVELEPLSGGQWRAKCSASWGPDRWIVIDEKTGAMHLEETRRR